MVRRFLKATTQGWYLEMIRNILNARNSKNLLTGSLLAASLVIIVVVTTLGLIVASSVVVQQSSVNHGIFSANANQVSEAGLEQSLSQLNSDDSFDGYTSPQVFFDNASQGYGVFTSEVNSLADSNSREIISTGKVFKNQSSTNPIATKKLRVIVVGTQSKGYSVFTGPGGLILGGSASITNSDVFVNGTIKMTGAASIGTASKPLNVFAANRVCPASGGPTYPQVCTSSEPISLAWSTYIYGTVCATGQTGDGPNNNIKPGNGGQGLKPGCTAPPVGQPTYDRQAQIDAVVTTKPHNNTDINCSSWRNPDGFKRTWPANLKITGNVSLSASCDLTITGDVYITGNLTISGAASLKVADSVGKDMPVIVVDGTINSSGSGSISANNQGTGARFISFKSSAACNPNCTDLTGNDLKNSQNVQTVSVSGAAQLPGMVFQSYWGKITLSGSGNLGSAIGQTVDMSGAGTVIFGTNLATGSKTWSISSYTPVY